MILLKYDMFEIWLWIKSRGYCCKYKLSSLLVITFQVYIASLISPFSRQCCKIPRSESRSLHNCCIPLPICYDVWGLGSWNLPVAGSISSYITWKQAQYTGKKSSCVINKVTIERSAKICRGHMTYAMFNPGLIKKLFKTCQTWTFFLLLLTWSRVTMVNVQRIMSTLLLATEHSVFSKI